MARRGGQKGNNNAGKAKDWENALRKAITQHKSGDALRKIADKVVTRALAGDQFAIKEIGDRLDGKPKVTVEATGADGAPLIPPAINVVGRSPG